MNEGGSAIIKLRVTVSPAGVPLHCDHPFLNGPVANAEMFCAMLKSTARFTPARNARGEPAYGTIQVWSHWNRGKWRGSARPQWNPSDLTLETNRMPKRFDDGFMFQLALQVDAAGKVESCSVVTPRVGDHGKDLLCREASAVTIPVPTDERGQPVPSVQEFVARVYSKKFLDRVHKEFCELTGAHCPPKDKR